MFSPGPARAAPPPRPCGAAGRAPEPGRPRFQERLCGSASRVPLHGNVVFILVVFILSLKYIVIRLGMAVLGGLRDSPRALACSRSVPRLLLLLCLCTVLSRSVILIVCLVRVDWCRFGSAQACELQPSAACCVYSAYGCLKWCGRIRQHVCRSLIAWSRTAGRGPDKTGNAHRDLTLTASKQGQDTRGVCRRAAIYHNLCSGILKQHYINIVMPKLCGIHYTSINITV